MTKEERDRLAELAAMAWGARRHEKDYSVFYGTDFKGIRAVWVSDGLVMVKGKELADAVDDWNKQKPSHKEVAEWLHERYCESSKGKPKNPTLHFEMPINDPNMMYSIGWTGPFEFDLSRKKKAQIKGFLGFIIGVLATALFNWIF
jgi:hypothetical protein